MTIEEIIDFSKIFRQFFKAKVLHEREMSHSTDNVKKLIDIAARWEFETFLLAIKYSNLKILLHERDRGKKASFISDMKSEVNACLQRFSWVLSEVFCRCAHVRACTMAIYQLRRKRRMYIWGGRFRTCAKVSLHVSLRLSLGRVKEANYNQEDGWEGGVLLARTNYVVAVLLVYAVSRVSCQKTARKLKRLLCRAESG